MMVTQRDLDNLDILWDMAMAYHVDSTVLSVLEKPEVLILCVLVKYIHSGRWEVNQTRSKGLRAQRGAKGHISEALRGPLV